MKTISDKIKSILLAATHSSNIGDIANELGVKVQVISGSLATIKKEELATYEDRKLVLTKAGLAVIKVKATKVKNKELVAALVTGQIGLRKATDEERPTIVDLIASTLNKDKVEARVYLYNHEKAAGFR